MMTRRLMRGRTPVVVAAVLFTLLMLRHSPASASWLVWQPEERVTYAPTNAFLSANGARSVACDAAGNIHVVWHDFRTGVTGVYHKAYDGLSWSADSLISNPAATAYYPAIAADELGSVHVVWTDHRDGNAEIYYRAFDGAAWSAPERLTNASGSSSYSSIATGPDEHLHVVWVDDRDGNPEIYCKTFDSLTWSGDERLTDDAAASGRPSVETDMAGRVYVVWQDSRDGNSEIYLKRFDGISWSADRRLTWDAGSSENPTIGVDPGGTWHVVWDDDWGGGREIYYKFYEAGTWSAAGPLTASPGEAAGPTIESDSSGDLHVVWVDSRDGNPGVYYKGSQGGAWGPDQPVTVASVESRNPSLAITPSDSVHVVWQDKLDGEFEVYRRWSTGAYIGPVQVTSIEPAEGFHGELIQVSDLAGDNFLDPVEVKLGKPSQSDIAATDLVIVSPHKMTCTLDLTGADVGYWDVMVENGDGLADTLPDGFWVRPWIKPSLASITPCEGFLMETAEVADLAGENFRTGAAVRFQKAGESDLTATDVVVVSPSRIMCKIDLAGPTGYWDVVVENNDGLSDTLSSAFWIRPWVRPVVTSIAPWQSSFLEIVEITDLAGDNFRSGARACLRKAGEPDLVAMNLAVVSAQSITCSFLLNGATGYWDVVVENNDGLSDTLPSGFWVRPWGTPVITSIAPSSANSGQIVDITSLLGDNFRSGLEVRLEQLWKFDIVSHDIDVLSPVEATCVLALPSGEAGAWDVVVENSDGLKDTLVSGFEIVPGIWGADMRLTDSPGFSGTSMANAHCVAADASGILHVVWFDTRDGNYEIYYKKFDSGWSADERLTTDGSVSTYPSVATAGDGSVHVVWSDNRDGNYEIYYKCNDGSGWEPDLRLTTSPGASRYPSIASDGFNNIHMVWEEHNGRTYEIRYRFFDGVTWGPRELIATGSYYDRTNPALAVDSDDNVHVVWRVSSGAIEYKKFDGVAWGTTQTLTYPDSPGPPAVAAGPEGRLHIVWDDSVDTGMGYDVPEVFYKGFDGSAWGEDIRISTHPADSYNATVAVDDTGDVSVMWMDDRSGDTDIYFRVFNGSTWEPERCLTSAYRESRYPFVCAGTEGKLHVVWSDRRDENYEIYYKVRDPGGLAGLEDPQPLPEEAVFLRTFPNPVIDGTNIRLGIGRSTDVGISVFDPAGRLVWRTSRRYLAPGTHNIRWDGRDTRGRPVAPGVYFVRINTGTTGASTKVVVLK